MYITTFDKFLMVLATTELVAKFKERCIVFANTHTEHDF